MAMSAERGERLGIEHGAGRVARIAQEQHLGARRDRRLDAAGSSANVPSALVGTKTGMPPLKTIAGRYDTYDGSCRIDLVARVDDGRHRRRDRLRRADSDADLRLGVVAERRTAGRGGSTARDAARAFRSCWCSASGPARSERTPSSTICGGVVKSGSPTPRLITSGMVAMTSKNLRMPEGGTARTRSDRRWRAAVMGSAVIRNLEGWWLGEYREPAAAHRGPRTG